MSTSMRKRKGEAIERFTAAYGPGLEPGTEGVPGTAARTSAVTLEAEFQKNNQSDLMEANEHLVVAALNARTMATESEVAARHLVEANANLMVASIRAQALVEVAELAALEQAHRTELEIKLAESKKLETMGVLAGGVAHDFNNLLTTIIGNCDLGLLKSEAGSPAEQNFMAINTAASRAAGLVRQLLAYAGKTRIQTSEVDLSQILQEIIHLLSVSLPTNIHIETNLEQRLPFVEADPTQIFQVLLNLVTNATEAFAARAAGAITILAKPVHLLEGVAASTAWLLPLKPGYYATLELKDNGVGMTPEVMAHIFDPFFTTKFTGRGLGLAAVMGILRSHRGGLHVESTLGQGTTFTLYLPALCERKSKSTPERLPRLKATGTLLIAGTGRKLRGTARRLAENLGFTVLEAGNDAEAVDLFRLHHQTTAMVLLDATLPTRGVLKRLKAIDAGVPVAVTRDYRTPGLEPAPPGTAGLLKHPYRIAEFQGMVQRTLKLRPSAA